MSNEEQTRPAAEKKSSLLDYVGNFIQKHDRLPHEFDKKSVVFQIGDDDPPRTDLADRISNSTDADVDDLSLLSDPIIETRDTDEQLYKQQVYLRQFQPPTPEPVDIQVQEIMLKPQVQRPPIHVHVGPPNNTRDDTRTPSPIFIKSAPPPPIAPPSDSPIVYNKYIPVNQKPPPQQIIIHRHPELPPKPRPIIIEQWLPNKPAPKRVTYRHVNAEEFIQSSRARPRNRYIEYKKPHTIVEVEIIRLPVIRLNPADYRSRSMDMPRLESLRSLVNDSNAFQWRI